VVVGLAGVLAVVVIVVSGLVAALDSTRGMVVGVH
jgi:hypothetical protein